MVDLTKLYAWQLEIGLQFVFRRIFSTLPWDRFWNEISLRRKPWWLTISQIGLFGNMSISAIPLSV